MQNSSGSQIVDIGEFIDLLRSFARKQVLVVLADGNAGIEGRQVYTAHKPLFAYKLMSELRLPNQAPYTKCYTLTLEGREFMKKALDAWTSIPWWKRVWARGRVH